MKARDFLISGVLYVLASLVMLPALLGFSQGLVDVMAHQGMGRPAVVALLFVFVGVLLGLCLAGLAGGVAVGYRAVRRG
jgi:hypothetical protein